MKFDLHVHTDLSYDSKMSVDTMIKEARKKGLSGVAVTDHNVFRMAPKLDDFYIIPACEFSTDVGHLIVYFQKTHINPRLSRDRNGRLFWRDICKFAHDQGALVFLAHPFSPKKPHPKSLFSNIDGIEIHNSRVVHSRIKGANDKAFEVAKALGKPFSAGSDAHCPEELGTSYWECDLPESAMSEPDFEEKLKAALLSGEGRVFAGCAPKRTVTLCKMRAYIRLRLYGAAIRAFIKLIICTLAAPFTRTQSGEHLNLKG